MRKPGSGRVVPSAPRTRGGGVRVVDATEKLRGVDEVVAEAREAEVVSRKASGKRAREAGGGGGLAGLLEVIERDAAREGALPGAKRQRAGGSSLKEQVSDLGATALKGRERREYEARRLARIGAVAPKAPKVPLKMLLGMRKKEREREENRRRYHKAMGLEVKKSSASVAAAAAKAAARAAGGHPAPETAQLGRFSGGVLQLSKRDIHTVVAHRAPVLGASALRSNAALAAAAAKRRPSDYATRQKQKKAGGKKKKKKSKKRR